MTRLSIVIPAYNEEDRIVPALEKSLGYLEKQDYSSEILVVSDGSNDSTINVVHSFAQKSPLDIRALEYHPNRGKGYAVAYGMTRAKGERILFMDADYAVPVEEVEKPMALLDKGYEIAIASRALPGSIVSHHQNFLRELSAKLYTFLQNFYLGFSYPDTQCGFKMFSSQAANDLFSRQKLHSVIFDAEILWLAWKSGYKTAQFPVKWSHVEDSRIQYDSISKSLFIFKELFSIKKLHGS